ncbi:hypothetical protein [Aquamicrobium sp. LC103]|uniref:hypothetical protein n=1 Tax=Aquamicrobium sp. LC103 TaxID=1120658 RepID=UPI000B0C5DBC|nr:hypothetical protein [Aquamicrobium sp. LC103]
MLKPLWFWILFVIGSSIHQATKLLNGSQADWGSMLTACFWVGVAMVAVHKGIVKP